MLDNKSAKRKKNPLFPSSTVLQLLLNNPVCLTAKSTKLSINNNQPPIFLLSYTSFIIICLFDFCFVVFLPLKPFWYNLIVIVFTLTFEGVFSKIWQEKNLLKIASHWLFPKIYILYGHYSSVCLNTKMNTFTVTLKNKTLSITHAHVGMKEVFEDKKQAMIHTAQKSHQNFHHFRFLESTIWQHYWF